MRRMNILWVSTLALGLSTTSFAQDAFSNDKDSLEVSTTSSEQKDLVAASTSSEQVSIHTEAENDSPSAQTKDQTVRHPRIEALKELKSIKIEQLKVDANAAQADDIKDPLQPLNRQIYEFNDLVDRNIAKPLAIQYTKKVPSEVRGSYYSFRKNLGEPWNAVNQLAQGRFSRAAKTLGRFTINTVTSLGLADPATRLGLSTEDEDLGITLGYYGVPTGPYIMLPIMGPSTLRDSFGRIFDSQARPQKYMFDNSDRIYYSEQLMRGIDARSQVLDFEKALQGDKYSALRDAYLQKKNFDVAQKKGLDSDSNLFIEDDMNEDDVTDDSMTEDR